MCIHVYEFLWHILVVRTWMRAKSRCREAAHTCVPGLHSPPWTWPMSTYICFPRVDPSAGGLGSHAGGGGPCGAGAAAWRVAPPAGSDGQGDNRVGKGASHRHIGLRFTVPPGPEAPPKAPGWQVGLPNPGPLAHIRDAQATFFNKM